MTTSKNEACWLIRCKPTALAIGKSCANSTRAVISIKYTAGDKLGTLIDG